MQTEKQKRVRFRTRIVFERVEIVGPVPESLIGNVEVISEWAEGEYSNRHEAEMYHTDILRAAKGVVR